MLEYDYLCGKILYTRIMKKEGSAQMDQKPRRSDHIPQNRRPQQGRREEGIGGRPRRAAPGNSQRRAVRYPNAAIQSERRRRPPFLFCVIMLVVVVVAAVALGWIFKGESREDSSSDSGYAKTAPDFSSLGQNTKVTHHVLLDAGHGFGDIGCSPDALRGVTEKEITIKAVKMLKSKLESKGYTVSLTHDGSAFTPATELSGRLNVLGYEYKADQIIDNNVFSAYERTMWANVLNAEDRFGAFVSLHVNSNDKTSLTGFTIDYCGANEHAQLSQRLSEAIDGALKRDYPGRSCDLLRDTWDDAYIVTKYSMMPSCLIEMGYGSSPEDAALLLDDAWLDGLVSSIADGIDAYYKE